MRQEIFRSLTIAYIRNTGPYGATNRVLMDRFKAILRERGLFDHSSVILGIALDDPALVPADRLRYDVGLVIPPHQDTGLARRRIADGPYAVFEVPHTQAGVKCFWQELPVLINGLPADTSRPVIERYAAHMVARHRCEFCVPLTHPL